MYVIRGLTQMPDSYEEAIKCLKDHYDRPKVTHHEHPPSSQQCILQAPIRKASNRSELCKLYDVCKQDIRAIELSNHFDLETFLTFTMELKLDEVTRIKWMDYSNDSQKTPLYSELLKFLDMQARHFESVTSEHKPQMTTHQSYTTTVEYDDACMACRKGKHPLANYRKFQGMSREERWDMVKKGSCARIV